MFGIVDLSHPVTLHYVVLAIFLLTWTAGMTMARSRASSTETALVQAPFSARRHFCGASAAGAGAGAGWATGRARDVAGCVCAATGPE
jgi:hypothetical protein